MNNWFLIMLFITIFVIVVLSMPLSCSPGLNTEGFYGGYYRKYCPSCGWRSRRSCANCINCGYCVTPSGYGECIPGDHNGPYFRDDCLHWSYGNLYYPYRWNLRRPRKNRKK